MAEEKELMSRGELVHIASRAVGAIQLGYAALDITALPDRVYQLHYYASLASAHATRATYQLETLSCIQIAMLSARVLGFLILGVLFWRCGPWVERTVFGVIRGSKAAGEVGKTPERSHGVHELGRMAGQQLCCAKPHLTP